MDQNENFQKLLRKLLEPIIDDCVTRAFNKYINELKFEQPAVNSNDVFDVDGAVNYLKLSKPTIYKLTMERQIPHYKLGKRLYFRK